jgi:hypothetical protein
MLSKSVLCVTGGFPSQEILGDLIQALLIHTLCILDYLLRAGVTVITFGTSAVAESIIYSIYLHNVGYIRWHRHNIVILTSDPEST